MKTFEISKEVTLDIDEVITEMPIVIEAAGNFININFSELEKIYFTCKANLAA